MTKFIAMLVTAISMCPNTDIVNTVDNNKELRQEDMKAFQTAMYRCKEIYGGSPCVHRFKVKLDPWGQRAYQITCKHGKQIKKKVQP